MTGPLAGLRVLDLGWIMVGPMSGRYLAELGADTIKIETKIRPDPLRGLGPFKDAEPGLERSLSYHLTNANKRGMAIDLKQEAGRNIVRALVEQADVLIESFTPGAVDQLGLSYASLAAINPRLVMVSTGILGRKGLVGLGMSGTGMTGSAYAGATYLMGWPDRPPTGPYGPWTDAVAPRFIVCSILAALHRRELTGEGSYIDVAQAEAGLQFLGPAYYDHALNGGTPERTGSAASAWRAPCGAYCCDGQDEWVVIDAAEASAWLALRAVLGAPLEDSRFETLVGRLRARADLDGVLGAWTRSRTAQEVETVLQAAGVPAHAICSDLAFATDEDLVASKHYSLVTDPVIGEAWLPGPQFQLRGTPQVARSAGPRIGDATADILASQLGWSEAAIAEAVAAGLLQ